MERWEKMGKLEGWGHAAVDGAVIGGIVLAFKYLKIDNLVGKGVMMMSDGAIPPQLAEPIVLGGSVFLAVFIYDLVMLYKYDE